MTPMDSPYGDDLEGRKAADKATPPAEPREPRTAALMAFHDLERTLAHAEVHPRYGVNACLQQLRAAILAIEAEAHEQGLREGLWGGETAYSLGRAEALRGAAERVRALYVVSSPSDKPMVYLNRALAAILDGAPEAAGGGLRRAMFDALALPDYKMRKAIEDALAATPAELGDDPVTVGRFDPCRWCGSTGTGHVQGCREEAR